MRQRNIALKAKSKLYWYLRGLNTRWDLARMSRESTGLGRSLKQVFLTPYDQISTREKTLIDEIEATRRRLSKMTDQISLRLIDLGDSPSSQENAVSLEDSASKTTIGEMCTISSVNPYWSFLLYKIIRTFKPTNCLELGTCMGISASYQAAALRMNESGRMTTMEGAGDLAKIARKNFEQLGLDNVQVVPGQFRDTLDGVLAEISPIDYAYIDGHHDEEATWVYFEKIAECLSERAILIFDDIRWTPGMMRVWKKIQSDHRVRISLDLYRIGLCILDKNLESKKKYRLPTISA
jgi:predicted O-methyltransferase YrrM